MRDTSFCAAIPAFQLMGATIPEFFKAPVCAAIVHITPTADAAFDFPREAGRIQGLIGQRPQFLSPRHLLLHVIKGFLVDDRLMRIFNIIPRKFSTSVELKDIVRRNNIRDVDMLERILTYITANIGTIFSANVLSKYLKSEGRSMATETIINYVKACTDAFLFYQVKRQDIQGKKLLAINEKYYVADHGIREAVFGGNMKDINLILENIVYLELLRRGYKVSIGKLDTKEIDFICEKQDKKIYIQVTYLLAAEETIQREFGFYNEITDNYPKYVLSLDEFDMSRNGIIHKNIRDFLTDASI